jgi:hypothetical protein
LTKEATSIFASPVCDSASIMSTLVAVGTKSFSI